MAWAKRKNSFGFTIVELLVVIVVIGVLAAIVVVAYNGVTTSARDTKRMADLKSLMKVLEDYYADNGGYPVCGSTGTNVSPFALSANTASACLTDELVPNYISEIPTDPTNSGSYQYRYAAGYKKTGPTSFSGTASDNYILGDKQESVSSPTYCGWGPCDLTLLLGSNNP